MTFQSGLLGPEFFGKGFVATFMFAGHDEVRGGAAGRCHFVLVFLPDTKRVVAAAGLPDFVALILEQAGDEFAHRALVLNQQNGFGAAANGNLVVGLFRIGPAPSPTNGM